MDVSPELTPSAPAREVTEDTDLDVTGRDICDPANNDWCPSPSQLPMPNFLSWYFEGRDIPTDDVHMPQGRPIDDSPTSLADGPSPTGPAVEGSAPTSPSAQSDASIPPPPGQPVPESSRTSDAPKEKIARTEPTTSDRTAQLGVLELSVPAGALPKASGVRRIDATSQTGTLQGNAQTSSDWSWRSSHSSARSRCGPPCHSSTKGGTD